MLIYNNETTISKTIESILPLNAKLLVGDIGSKDQSVNICKRFGCNVLSLNNLNKCQARNEMIKRTEDCYIFYIEPWEILIDGYEEIKNIKEGDFYYVNILENDVLTKQTRIFNKNKGKFINPVFEKLSEDNALYCEATILSKNKLNDYDKEIHEWKKLQPLCKDACYYEACIKLSKGDYKNFIPLAEHYLFREKHTISSSMLRYYLALAYMIVGNYKSAIDNISICLDKNHNMAEFWCLLGDVFVQTKNFPKAIEYYENAIKFGNERLKTDKWPIHISRYDEYPNEMIEKCQKIVDSASNFKTPGQVH